MAEDLETMVENYETTVVLSDEHFCYVNPEMVSIAEKYIKKTKPKYRVHLGDLFDNPGMSVFDQDPHHAREFQEELDEGVRYLARLHKASPDTKVIVIYGNHDHSRLERRKSEVPYAFKHLRNLELSKLIIDSAKDQGLEIGDVTFAKEWRLSNAVTFLHGDPRMDARIKGGVTGPRRTAETFPGDDHIVMGHRHRYYVGRDPWCDREVHHVAGMLDTRRVHYNTCSKYENGFMVIHCKPQVRPRPEVVFQNVLYKNGGVFLDGRKWTA